MSNDFSFFFLHVPFFIVFLFHSLSCFVVVVVVNQKRVSIFSVDSHVVLFSLSYSRECVQNQELR